ncbi:MAG: insulinase family protein [Clostridia bacterium]|nr:insulinase family protein [Clostridia bacterium]
MKQIDYRLNNDIKVHLIKNDKFKTDLLALFLTVPLKRENVTKNALIPIVLKRGCELLKTQNEINERLEEMYGAVFDAGLDKTGDNLIIKFYLESINDNFLPGQNNNLDKSIELISNIVFNPLIQNDGFLKEIVDSEKNNLKVIIESKKDNKDRYALDRCINSIYGDNGYGLSKLGYIEDLDKIDEKKLYQEYLKLIKTAKIDFFVSGDFNEDKISIKIKGLENNELLKNREEVFKKNDFREEKKEKLQEIKEIKEEMDVKQGKLVIGLDILPSKLGDYRFIAAMYNTILGDGANSKLFQNVREKAGLAYTAKSNYIIKKNNIFIRCGIEIDNYEKAVDIIKQQLEDIEKGKFSDEDIANAKKYIISGIKAIYEEQDTGIIFSYGQEMSPIPITPEEYKDRIEKVTKEQIIEFAKNVSINTIYFITGKNI